MVSQKDIEEIKEKSANLRARKHSLEKAYAKRKAQKDQLQQELVDQGVDLSDIPEEKDKLEEKLKSVYAKMASATEMVETSMKALEDNLL